ncbi:MAG: ribosome biogenesis GTP-binding protein YihA/YsxC [Armatimonadetes bacterium]|nr:ribosome biogenesis GTP-binding protein YihA/YsxC [Armatimonadota bacterium]
MSAVGSVEFFAAAAKLEQCPAGQRPEVALAGRSNVGKSSLLNTLAGKKNLAVVSKTPGRTQTINFYLVDGKFFLVDLPGYGFAKVPAELQRYWGVLVEGYLRDRPQLAGVVQIVDVRHPPTELDRQLSDWLRHYGVPAAVAATKADKISRGRVLKQLQVIRKTLGLPEEIPLITFSAKTGEGRPELWRVVRRWAGLAPGFEEDNGGCRPW